MFENTFFHLCYSTRYSFISKFSSSPRGYITFTQIICHLICICFFSCVSVYVFDLFWPNHQPNIIPKIWAKLQRLSTWKYSSFRPSFQRLLIIQVGFKAFSVKLWDCEQRPMQVLFMFAEWLTMFIIIISQSSDKYYGPSNIITSNYSFYKIIIILLSEPKVRTWHTPNFYIDRFTLFCVLFFFFRFCSHLSSQFVCCRWVPQLHARIDIIASKAIAFNVIIDHYIF